MDIIKRVPMTASHIGSSIDRGQHGSLMPESRHDVLGAERVCVCVCAPVNTTRQTGASVRSSRALDLEARTRLVRLVAEVHFGDKRLVCAR